MQIYEKVAWSNCVTDMLRSLKSFCTVILLSTFPLLCFAETPRMVLMPEDAGDGYVGLVVRKDFSCEEISDAKWRANPVWFQQFGNGFFLKDRTVGWHVQKNERMEFGPFIDYKRVCEVQQNDEMFFEIEERERISAGAFLNYSPSTNWRVSSRLSWSDKTKHPRQFSLSVRNRNSISAHASFSVALEYRYQNAIQVFEDIMTEHVSQGLYGVTFLKPIDKRLNEIENHSLDLNIHYVQELNSRWVFNAGARYNKNFSKASRVVDEISKWEFLSGLLWRF